MTNQIDIASLLSNASVVEDPSVGAPSAPFTPSNSPSSPSGQSATPAQPSPGGDEWVLTSEGLVPASALSEETPSQSAPSAAPAPDPKPTESTNASEKSVEDLARELAAEQVRQFQSSADKRIAALEKQILEAQEANKKAERERALNADFLDDEDKERLRRSYELEDREAQVAAREQAALDLHAGTYRVTLAQEYGKFGVTYEDLEGIASIEELDSYVTKRELEFYRQNGVSKQAAAVTAETHNTMVNQQAQADQSNQSAAPAGALAPSDVGGNAPSRQVVKLKSGTGADVMRENIESIPFTYLRFN